MTVIKWILFKEKVVARNSPNLEDVDNRPLRQILELSAWDPDDPNFTGLHHHPVGLFSDDITEEHVGSGVHIHNPTTITGDVDIVGGAHVSGDFHLDGQMYGAINTLNVTAHLTVDRVVSDDGWDKDYALLEVGSLGAGKLEVKGSWGAFISLLALGTELKDGLTGTFPYEPVMIGADPAVPHSGEPVFGFIPFRSDFPDAGPTLLHYLGRRTQWVHVHSGVAEPVFDWEEANSLLTHHADTGFLGQMIAPFTGIHQWDADAGVSLTRHLLIARPEAGWTAGTGTQTKGGLDTATATAPQVAAVVNALVNALLNNHHLLKA